MGLTGTSLDRYEVHEELGRGGMSVVYRGLDTTLQRRVAIKVLHDHLTEDQQARDRLHREAVAVAKLQHKNIIEVFDFSTGSEGPAYIVMEYVEGQSLADILKSLSFESCPEQGLHFLRRIVSALEHAHDNGVIHRDLKPENVLLSEDGHLKLMDFGIARLVDGNAMTLTGTLLGSPGYMAPEYIEAKPTDHRVDIFAFGVLLYRSLTGKNPFEGESPASVLLKITKGEWRAPNELNQEIHPLIAELIAKCLAKSPSERFRSARDLKDALDRLLGYAGIPEAVLNNEVIQVSPRVGETAPFSIEHLQVAYSAAFERALSKKDRRVANGHADRLIGLDPGQSDDLRQRLSTLGQDRNRSRFPMVFGACLVLCMVGFGVAGTFQASPPQPTISQAIQVPVPSVTPPIIDLAIECEEEEDLEIRIDEGEWLTSTALSTLAVEPGTHRLELRLKDKTESVTIEVAPDGSTQPDTLSCPAAPLPDAEASVEAKPFIAEADSTKTKAPAPTKATKPSTRPNHIPTKPQPPPRVEVTFRTGGAWVDVEVDGKVVKKNQLGVFKIKLEVGQRTLRFLNPLAKPLKISLDVDESLSETPRLIRLSPLDATLQFKGFPPKTVVQLRGKASLLSADGTDTPLAVAFPDNKSQLVETIRIIFPDGIVKTHQVELKPGKLTTLDVAATR